MDNYLFFVIDSNTNSYIWINVFEMLSKYFITVASAPTREFDQISVVLISLVLVLRL